MAGGQHLRARMPRPLKVALLPGPRHLGGEQGLPRGRGELGGEREGRSAAWVGLPEMPWRPLGEPVTGRLPSQSSSPHALGDHTGLRTAMALPQGGLNT